MQTRGYLATTSLVCVGASHPSLFWEHESFQTNYQKPSVTPGRRGIKTNPGFMAVAGLVPGRTLVPPPFQQAGYQRGRGILGQRGCGSQLSLLCLVLIVAAGSVATRV